MKLEFVKVDVGKSKPQKTLKKEVFKHYFETMGYSRKEFTTKLGLNHRVFTNGLKAYYTKEQIEELRIKKIVKTNIGNRVITWENKLKDIEVFIPGFTKLFIDNVKDNPEVVLEKLVEINDLFYKFKKALKPIKKYLNQSLTRLGKDRIRLVGNGLEATVKFILDDLGIIYTCQFPLGSYRYDFKINNTLIEVDGKQYHEDNSRDISKEKYAHNRGYKLLRLTEEMIKKQPIKTRKCLQNLK